MSEEVVDSLAALLRETSLEHLQTPLGADHAADGAGMIHTPLENGLAPTGKLAAMPSLV